MKVFQQSLVIALTIATVYIVNTTELKSYTAQILGILIVFSVIYIVLQKRKNRSLPQDKQKDIFIGSNLEFFGITAGILLTILLTDGIYSNLFFLTYFLLFGLSFMYEPITVFVFLIGVILLFLNQALQVDTFDNLIRLGSLILLSPIAYFFGREYKRRTALEDDIDKKTTQIINDLEKVVENDTQNMNNKQIDAIDDISNQANDLREELDKK